MAVALQHRHEGQVATASGLDVLAGIWLLISPFVIGFASANATSTDVICGIIVTILAAVRFFGAYEQGWMSWINALVGLWTLISPWVLGFARDHNATTNNVVMGIIILCLGCWSALASASDVRDTDVRDINRGDYPPAM